MDTLAIFIEQAGSNPIV